MNTIDFLPQRYREARIARRRNLWGLTLCVAFGGLIGAAFVGQSYLRHEAEQELAFAEIEYQATKQAQQALDDLRAQARRLDEEAELLTYLRHPWPRTQVLHRITVNIPREVVLSRVNVSREENANKGTIALGVIKPAETPASNAPLPTNVELDLKQLRNLCDSASVAVELTGYTSDLTALHGYLNVLASESLFVQAELTSIETVDKASERRSQFAARLVLAPGHGQRSKSAPPSTLEPRPLSSKQS